MLEAVDRKFVQKNLVNQTPQYPNFCNRVKSFSSAPQISQIIPKKSSKNIFQVNLQGISRAIFPAPNRRF